MMRERVLFIGLALVLARTETPAPTSTQPSYPKFDYPAAKRGDVVDNYHGVEIADPYRWLEDPDSDPTGAWVKAENTLTFGFLKAIPERSRINARITALWDYEKYGVPFKQGGRYFYTKNDGLQNQRSIVNRQKKLHFRHVR
jgi:prolyl oligopeptidase